MNRRVLKVATISPWGSLLLARGDLELANAPPNPVITILMMLMIAPCTINCLTCFVSAQVNKLEHAVPVQQGYTKLYPTTENITHPQLDTTITTLKLEPSKRGRPNAPCHPSSAGSSQRDLDAPIPKELGLPSLEEGIVRQLEQTKGIQNSSG